MATDSKTAIADGALDRRDDGRQVVRFERHLDHPIERVWAALTEPVQMIAWWGEAEVDLVVGGRFKVSWLNTDDGGNTAVMNATITELDAPTLLETDGDIHGVLRWQLQPGESGGTDLSFSSTLEFSEEFLAERKLPKDMRSSLLAGWHIHLDHLADALEGGRVEWPNWTRDHRPQWAVYEERYSAMLG
jgi:uncharacterized protein YndB with AHSA1/START domain